MNEDIIEVAKALSKDFGVSGCTAIQSVGVDDQTLVIYTNVHVPPNAPFLLQRYKGYPVRYVELGKVVPASS